MNLIFAKSSQNYGISDRECISLIDNNQSFAVGLSREGNEKIAWVGFDQGGIRLECIAIVFTNHYYIMHLKPISSKESISEIKNRLW
jgi:hypothetical protein